MDCIKYVNSRDVRKYLYKIDFKLNVEQQLFLIVMCDFITLKEKLAALEELLNSSEDAPMTSISNPVFSESLGLTVHEFIRRYLADKKAILSFIKEASSDYFYEAEHLERHLKDFQHIGFYSNYDNALEAIREYAEDEDIGVVQDYYRIRKYVFSECVKDTDGPVGDVAECILSKNAEVITVDCHSGCGMNLYGVDVSAMHISLPMPFKRGDIVKKAGIPYGALLRSIHPEYAVFLSYTPAGKEDLKDYHDGTDILYWGLFPVENGFYKDHSWLNYDLEYADKDELEGINCKLIPLSEMIKGNLPPDLFYSAVRTIELRCQMQTIEH